MVGMEGVLIGEGLLGMLSALTAWLCMVSCVRSQNIKQLKLMIVLNKRTIQTI